MDGREQLRRYLEQRRESGERELVLDGLAVEDLMRLLGAKGGTAAASSAHSGSPAAPARPAASTRARPDRAPASPGETLDWRTELRAAGGAPADAGRSDEGMNESPAPGAAAPPRDAAGPGSSRTADALASPGPTPEGSRYGMPAGLSVGGETRTLSGGFVADLASLDAIAASIAACTRCPLHATAINPVPGEGDPNAGLMCVGEAPGANEDASGRPFVGQAGQLLTKILAAIDLRREDVFIANVLKHRPPENRNPKPDEVIACSPYLVRQIEIIRPRVIVAFGTFAAQTLLNTRLAIGKLRGQVHRYYGVPLIVTYHPAALLRNPAWKRPTWEDVQLARRILDSAADA